MNSAVVEVAVSTGATTAVATSVSAEPILTALIGLAVSIITVLSTEGVKLLVAWFKKRREDIEGEDNKKEGDK